MQSPTSASAFKSMTVSSFWVAVAGISCLKMLLLYSYRSTDFEVHRNWLAITHSLPLEKWYYEKTSEWTLDYPPFFAYFEWILSQVAQYFDKDMLKISNLNYASLETIVFQKLSVILADLLLAFSVLKCSSASSVLLSSSSSSPRRKSGSSSGIPLENLFLLIFLNAGLFIVDHIHFQYNGFLFGILLLSVSKCLEGKYYQSALIFAVLLNFKHIFLYMAPAFGVYFLRQQCFPHGLPIRPSTLARSLLSFAAIGISVLGLSFGPFYKHIPQILQRLFPFQRGLSHAYWAPNFWAAYNSLDWLLNLILKKEKSSVTSGLVGTASLSVLPQVLPIHTFLLTLAIMLPALLKLWQSPTPTNFLKSVVLTAWTSFMFGYHVHEKAILNVIIPFALLAFQEPNLFFLTLTTGTISLFPLLYTPTEIVLKAIITILHLSLIVKVLPLQKFTKFQLAYLIGFVLVYLFENLGQVILPNYPFLPLMLISDYCLLGISYCYLTFYGKFLPVISRFTPKSSSGRTTTTTTTYIFTSSTTSKINLNGSIEKSISSSPPTTKASPSPKKLRFSSTSSGSNSPETTPGRLQTSRSKKSAAIPTSDRVLRKRNK